MGNLLDYLETTTDTFEERPFSQVDSLVLSELAYLYFDGFVPGPGEGEPILLHEMMNESAITAITQKTRVPQEDARLLKLAAVSPRFAGMRMGNYVNIINKEAEQQFSAVTFYLHDCPGGNSIYIAFRGTDGYYVAWKEDFNLAFISPLPSQVTAADYVNWVASSTQGPLYLGGHSKGGNLAVYAGLFCNEDVKNRIPLIFSHDGPGFPQEIFETPEFAAMKTRIRKTVPHSSLVGILLQHQEEFQIIKSSQVFIMQHDPYSWIIEGGSFQYTDSLSASSQFLDKNLNQWISSLSKEELSDFADALYQLLCALGGEEFANLPSDWWTLITGTLEGLKGLSGETYHCILHTVKSLATLAFKNLELSIKLPEINLPSLPQPKNGVKSFSLPESLLKHLPGRSSGQTN